MSNTLLTPSVIATRALPILENNLVMGSLVTRDLDATFANVGDTIKVRKPAVFEAVEFDGDLTGEYQAIAESSVDVKLDKILDVSVEVTSKEMTLDIDSFTEQITTPALASLAQKIDAYLTGLYIDIPYKYGVSGATPNELKDISQVRRILNENKVPLQMRKLVVDPEADAEFGILSAFADASFAGRTDGLTEAALGRKLGFDIFMDQNIKTHTSGAYAYLADVSVTTGAADATSIVLTSAATASTAKLLKGDLMTIDGEDYVVTADTAAAISGVVTVAIYPGLAKAFGDMASAAVTFPDRTAKAHTANLAFHQNAFALVSRPLMPPVGGATSATAAIKNGISVRVTYGYDQDTKTNKISFDALVGVKTLYPELAAQLLG